MARHRAKSSGSTKRQSVWFSFPPIRLGLSNTGAVLYTLNTLALALRPFTIVRSYFEMLLLSDQTAAKKEFGAAVGLCVVSDQAVDIGVSAIPIPVDDLGSDLWFAHQLLFGAQGSGTDGGSNLGHHFAIDSKAMRKVGLGSDISVTAQSMAGSIADGSVLLIAGRMLIKTH